MPCGLNLLIETIIDCKRCYHNWPDKQNKRYTRAQCKMKNWFGKVDESHENKAIDVINNNPISSLVEWLRNKEIL